MSAEIYENDVMFWARYEPTHAGWNAGGTVPWHKKGQPIDPETTPQMLRGLLDERGNAFDFTVTRDPLVDYRKMVDELAQIRCGIDSGRFSTPSDFERAILQIEAGLGHRLAYEDVHGHGLDALYREGSDKIESLGTAKKSYKVLQNSEVLDVVSQLRHPSSNEPLYVETAGTLKRGTKVYISLRMDEREVVPGDTVKRYFFAISSHDGSASFQIMYTDVRPVCANTVGRILRSDAQSGFKIRHTANMAQRIEQAAQQMGLVMAQSDEQLALYKELANKPISSMQFRNVVGELVPIPERKIGAKTCRKGTAINKRGDIISLFEGRGKGSDMTGVRGTAWGGFNAITEYITHESSYGRKGASSEKEAAGNLMLSVVGGAARQMTEQGAELLLAA